MRGPLLAIALSALGAGVGCDQLVGRERPKPESSLNGPLALAAQSPADEIHFDHAIHAGKYGMQCLDCHAGADKSPVAGLPSERKCMGCHKFVAKDNPEVKLLAKDFDEGKSLRWTRVFAVPDYIYFSHRVHVLAHIDCKECHGDMAASKIIHQDVPFTMGRCLSCHETRGAPRDCLTCHK